MYLGPPAIAYLDQEEEGDSGCLGVEYRRGSTGGSSSSTCGPSACGLATYSNSPLPSIEGPLAQRHVAEATVKRHLANIYEEIGVRSRNEAVRRALEEQWIGIHEITSADGDGSRDGQAR